MILKNPAYGRQSISRLVRIVAVFAYPINQRYVSLHLLFLLRNRILDARPGSPESFCSDDVCVAFFVCIVTLDIT